MIRVRARRNSSGNPVGIEVKGHALFAPRGSDIVCAAVSMLTQTIIFALEDLVKLKFPVKIKEGYLSVSAPPGMEKEKAEKFFLLMETMLLGLKETARSYPSYIVYTEDS
ncbi:MAG: ribosomal-processing cysteine protease Prp [Dethiobacteria bacterium]|jgi:uncharacterized protein YsxB (DUF464 family)